MHNLYDTAVDIATHPRHTRWVAPCLLVADAVLCGLIVWKVPYTEIDWETYMIQISKFLPSTFSKSSSSLRSTSSSDFDTNYLHLSGPTGPLVYPALHVYIHSALYLLTSHGADVPLAQGIYAGLYLATIAVVFAVYRRVDAPPWLLVPLVLSKRLHSIFLLRLFNDAWAALLFWTTVYMLQRRRWTLAAILWGLGLGVKMTLLLSVPALVMTLFQGAGTNQAVILGTVVTGTHVLLALPFLLHGGGKGTVYYLTSAFDLGRQFLYKWTVNWRFVDESTFLSREFAVCLLLLHVTLLLVFVRTRWVKPTGQGIWNFVKRQTTQLQRHLRTRPRLEAVSRGRKVKREEEEQRQVSQKVNAIFVTDAMLASMAIGMLCARSLHYQFFTYLGWISPYLLWRGGANPVWVLVNWAVQEWAWLVFPSTNLSSSLVVLELSIQTLSALIASPIDHTNSSTTKKIR